MPLSPVERRALQTAKAQLPPPIRLPAGQAGNSQLSILNSPPQAAYTPPDADEWERLRQIQLDKLRAAGVMEGTT
jgi:hypothetical protein